MLGPARRHRRSTPVVLKGILLQSTLGMLVALQGCALGGPATLAPSPGIPTLGASRLTRHPASSLVIFTDRFIDLNLGDPDDGTQVRPTGYTLYDSQGNRIQYERNYIGSADTEPVILEIEPGRYLVLLDKPGIHPPQFWVVIEQGKLTEVKLSK